MAHSFLQMVATYVFHPYRPRFTLARRTDLLGVSLWMLVASAAHKELGRFVETVRADDVYRWTRDFVSDLRG